MSETIVGLDKHLSAGEVVFEQDSYRHLRRFVVLYEEQITDVAQHKGFSIEIHDAIDGNQDWWLNISQARALADALTRKLDALELEKLPPPLPLPTESNMPPWLNEDKDD